MTASSIATLNKLSEEEKRLIYSRFIPGALLARYSVSSELRDADGRELAHFTYAPGTTDVTLTLRHRVEAPDPLLFAHLTDTMNGQIYILLYILNDPHSPRFDVDRMPDGSPTQFGLLQRNLAAEEQSLAAGLAPGQVRRGVGMLRESVEAFESFIASLEHQVYFIDPLYYHNAVIFERYGFAYQKGRRRMEAYHTGFQPGGGLRDRLDSSSPFRQPWMADSVRGRSWAMHDGIADQIFTDVTMYKRLQDHAGIDTYPGGVW
jgi:hypothetical protein